MSALRWLARANKVGLNRLLRRVVKAPEFLSLDLVGQSATAA